MEYVRIVIDTEGSDKGASMVVKGAADALAKYENLAIVLVGDRDKLLTECSSLGIEEGERVFKGTVIEVNFYYQDTSE